MNDVRVTSACHVSPFSSRTLKSEFMHFQISDCRAATKQKPGTWGSCLSLAPRCNQSVLFIPTLEEGQPGHLFDRSSPLPTCFPPLPPPPESPPRPSSCSINHPPTTPTPSLCSAGPSFFRQALLSACPGSCLAGGAFPRVRESGDLMFTSLSLCQNQLSRGTFPLETALLMGPDIDGVLTESPFLWHGVYLVTGVDGSALSIRFYSV